MTAEEIRISQEMAIALTIQRAIEKGKFWKCPKHPQNLISRGFTCWDCEVKEK